MSQRLDLAGSVVIVTGSSQGLGEAMAIGLANAGAKVVIASIDEVGAARVAGIIGEDSALPVTADITSEEDCERIVRETLRRFGDLTALVNNARRTTPEITQPFWESPVEFWDASIKINVFGTYLMTRAAVGHMMRRKFGRIINISTSLDTMRRRHYAPYGVTKAAIDAQTEIWSKDLADTGVTVNTLIPGGACDTRAHRSRAPSREGAQLLPASVMVDPAAWLVSPRSSGVTGSRFIAKKWDNSLSWDEAALACREPSIFRDFEEC